MGIQSKSNPRDQISRRLLYMPLIVFLFCSRVLSQSSTPLLLPICLAFDAQGNLYFSESGRHVVRKLAPSGALTVVAGTGVQGAGADGTPAQSSPLDSPGALAVDSAGDLYIADTHNHRIRKIDAATGLIATAVGTGMPGLGAELLPAQSTPVDLPSALAVTSAGDLLFADARTQVVRRVDHATGLVTTVAGNGVQGFAGDGGPARAASLDSPGGLALDSAGNLFISDSHNQRVRRVDALTGTISTVAGGAVNATQLRLPRGLAIDPTGVLLIVDAGNQVLRRIDPVTGQVSNVAGQGTEGFAGDEAPAIQAEVDSPRAVAVSPAGLPTFADTANARVRQVDGAGIIHTIAGVGAIVPAGLVLSGATSSVYGTGSLTATLGGAAGSGTVSLLEGRNTLTSAALVGNIANLSLVAVPAGIHTLTATFAGDSSHGPLVSNLQVVTITPAPISAIPASMTGTYGLAVPTLSGSVSGILPQDSAAVQVVFTSAATPLSGAGTYPIQAALTGTSAGNYSLTTAAGTVTINKAPSTISLSSGLLAHIATTTAGQPGGAITLLDGSSPNATLAATPTGDAQFSSTGLTNGTHTLSATYAGDGNFLPTSSTPIQVAIGPQSGADFAVASAGAPGLTVSAGSSAVFSFAETPINGGLSSAILLSVSGLPSGATATFSPSYLPPGSSPSSFTLTVQTIKTASVAWPGGLVVAGFLGILLFPRRRRAVLGGAAVLLLVGCGDRINSAGQGTAQSRTYNLTVNATATSNSGSTLLHSVAVTLTVQ